MRRRGALLLGVAAPLLAAAPAGATQVEIKAVDVPASWDKPAVAISPGDTVVWSFAGTRDLHNVASTSPNWSFTSGQPVAAAPSAFWTFTTPGHYDFVCQVHAGMSGTVTVGDVPPPPPPPLSEQPLPNDSPLPDVSLAALETGGLDRTRPTLRAVRVKRMKHGARIAFRVSERARVTVRFKRGRKVVKTRHVNAVGAESVTVRGRALRAGRYRVQLRAEDVAGNRSGIRTARLTMR